MHENDASSILVPAPTPWPFIASLGIALMFSGIVTHIAVTMVGTVVLLRAAIGWWFDVLPEQKEDAVSVSAADLAAARVPKSSSKVDRLTNGVERHRVRIPVEVHPYWTGLYGGLVGAVAMAVVAMLFGLIAQGSIWYPINLLAAGILPSLDHASIAQLRQFSEAGLIVCIIYSPDDLSLCWAALCDLTSDVSSRRHLAKRPPYSSALVWTHRRHAQRSQPHPERADQLDLVCGFANCFRFNLFVGHRTHRQDRNLAELALSRKGGYRSTDRV